MLRQKYKMLLRRFFSREIGKCRIQLQLTQEEFSERLCMAPRSYVDLEHGTSGCSDVTLVLFLDQLKDEEILRVVHGAGDELRKAGRHDVA